MKIVVLDGYTENPGDLSWSGLEAFGEVKVYDRVSYEESSVIAEVIGFGDMVLSEDEYNGYYDMYAVRNIYIKKILTRDEIIKMMLNVNENRAFRFVQFYPLSDEEKEMFKLGYASSEKVLDGIRYYQEGDKDVYSRKSPSYVKKIGENNG